LKIQVSDAELETNPEFMQVAAPSDTVVLIAFEVNSQHASGLVNLCYPYFTLEPVMAYLNVQTWASRERGRRESGREERLVQLDRISAPVKVMLGSARVSLGEVLNLEEGDILRLETSVKQDAVVFVGDRPKFLGRPGLMGKRRAIQLTEPIIKEDETNYMTDVQKTETYVL